MEPPSQDAPLRLEKISSNLETTNGNTSRKTTQDWLHRLRQGNPPHPSKQTHKVFVYPRHLEHHRRGRIHLLGRWRRRLDQRHHRAQHRKHERLDSRRHGRHQDHPPHRFLCAIHFHRWHDCQHPHVAHLHIPF